MNWFAKYVVEPNGMVNWRAGMLVTDEGLVEAFEKDQLIAVAVQTSAVSGVRIGEA